MSQTDQVSPNARKAGRYLYIATVVFLCAWVLVPLYICL